jgi:MFS family permease
VSDQIDTEVTDATAAHTPGAVPPDDAAITATDAAIPAADDGDGPGGSWWSRRTGGLDASYWRLWGAVASSNLGDGLVSLALPWLATLLTRDALAIAAVALATRLPWLVFSLHAGALTDRFDRRKLMVLANSLRALIVGGAAAAIAFDVMTLPLLYVAGFVLGMCEVVFDNTSQTILPALVPRGRLERANGNIMGAQMVIADFVARPIAGAMVGVALALPFAIDAVTAAVSAALVASIPGSFRTPHDPEVARPAMRTQIAEGLRWLWRHRLLRTLALALATMNGVAAAALATYVLFVQEILGLDGLGFGLLLTAGSIGGLLGSVLAPNITARLGSGRSLFLAVLVPTIAFLVTATTSNVVLVGVAFASFSFTAIMWNVVTVSLRQVLIPDHLLGRVNSVYRFFGWGAMPIGTLLGGLLVQAVEVGATRELGLRAPFLAAAGAYLLLAIVVSPKLTSARVDAARTEAETTTA